MKLKEGVVFVSVVGRAGSGCLKSKEMLGFDSAAGGFEGLKGEVSNIGPPVADVVGVVDKDRADESENENKDGAGFDVDFIDDSAFF